MIKNKSNIHKYNNSILYLFLAIISILSISIVILNLTNANVRRNAGVTNIVFAAMSELDTWENNDVQNNPTPVENMVVTPSGHTLFYYITDAVNKYVSLEAGVRIVDIEIADPIFGDLIIPATITISGETYTVKGFRAFAFGEKDAYFTSVTLPDTIRRIGYASFTSCGEYHNDAGYTIDLNKVESIGSYAFAGSCLKEIYMPNTIIEIGDNIFGDCGLLETIYVVEGSYAEEWVDANGLSSLKQYYTPQSSSENTGIVANIVLPTIFAVTLGTVTAMYLLTFKRKKRI